MSPSSAVAELLLRYEDLHSTGHDVSPEVLCKDCPDLLGIVKQHLADLRVVDRFLQPDPAQREYPTVDPPLSEQDADGSPDNTIVTGATYRIEKLHARGGLGVIHLAVDDALGRSVALKRMQALSAPDSQRRNRFRWEAEVTSRLEHPGIVPVYGIGTDSQGEPCYAMRFVHGETLEHAIHRFHEEKAALQSGERAIRFRKLLQQFVAVCNTIAYAHSRGIVHRDIKPANILLGAFGETLVVDWGLAKEWARQDGESDPSSPAVAHSDSTWQATETGNLLGTPTFMSPEQAAGQVSILGPASDIWSLGATLYVLLVNQTPYVGRHVGEILEQVKTGAVVHPRKIMPSLPRSLEAVCLKALAIRPEDRYPTALHLAGDIEHWLADEPVSVYHEPFHVRVGRWTRRHKAFASVCTVAMIAAVIFSVYVTYRQDRETDLRRQWARDQIDKLMAIPAAEVPVVLDDLPLDDPWVVDRLRRLAAPSASAASKREADNIRLRARLALLRRDPSETDALIQQMIQANPENALLIFGELQSARPPFAALGLRLEQELRRLSAGEGNADQEHMRASEQATAAALLLRAGKADEVWPLLGHSGNPTRRSFLIHRVVDLAVPPNVLLGRLRLERDAPTRRALLLALGGFSREAIPEEERAALYVHLVNCYTNDPDAGVHSATEWVIHRQYGTDRLPPLEKRASENLRHSQWSITKHKHTMITIRRPGKVPMGSPLTELDREKNEAEHTRNLDYDFAIANKEVSVSQYQVVFPTYEGSRYNPSSDCPALGVTWYEAAMYCRVLSELEGVPESEMCYPTRAKITEAFTRKDALRLPDKYLQLTGYRLPTEAEWEFACRADLHASRCYGSGDELLRFYGWSLVNAQECAHPCGLLKPNDFGFFDMHGNAYEWCHDQKADYPVDPIIEREIVANENARVLRGGAFLEPPRHVRSARRDFMAPASSLQSVGFRIARTIRSTSMQK